LIRGFRQIAILTMVSRVLGFARDTAYAIVFGPGPILDAWLMAFKIPNLGRRLFGEGAASASVIPVYSQQLSEHPEQAASLPRTVLTVLFLILSGLVLAGEIVILLLYVFWSDRLETKLVFSLAAVTLPYMIVICLVAVIAGFLNVHKHFATPALAPIVMNLCIIGSSILAVVVFPLASRVNGGKDASQIYSLAQPAVRQIFFVAWAVILAGCLEFAVQLPPYFKRGLSLRPAWDVHSEPFRRILRLMLPMIFGLAVTQINTLADDLLAWWFSGSVEKGETFSILGHVTRYPLWRGSISYLSFAQHLYQLPLGIFGISLATALFPVMSAEAAKKDYQALCRVVSMGVRAAVFIALPCTVGLVLVAKPFISVWLRHGRFQATDVPQVFWPLAFYAIGITGYILQHIVVRAFHSLQDPVSPVRTGLLAVAANLTLSVALIWPLGASGLAAATAVSAYLQVGLLLWMLHRRLGGGILTGLWPTFSKTVVATIGMSAAVVLVLFLCRTMPLPDRYRDPAALCAALPVGAGIYVLAAKLLRNDMLGLLIGARAGRGSVETASIAQ
jgi:putative peptidoglycan lipid II flippase